MSVFRRRLRKQAPPPDDLAARALANEDRIRGLMPIIRAGLAAQVEIAEIFGSPADIANTRKLLKETDEHLSGLELDLDAKGQASGR